MLLETIIRIIVVVIFSTVVKAIAVIISASTITSVVSVIPLFLWLQGRDWTPEI